MKTKKIKFAVNESNLSTEELFDFFDNNDEIEETVIVFEKNGIKKVEKTNTTGEKIVVDCIVIDGDTNFYIDEEGYVFDLGNDEVFSIEYKYDNYTKNIDFFVVNKDNNETIYPSVVNIRSFPDEFDLQSYNIESINGVKADVISIHTLGNMKVKDTLNNYFISVNSDISSISFKSFGDFVLIDNYKEKSSTSIATDLIEDSDGYFYSVIRLPSGKYLKSIFDFESNSSKFIISDDKEFSSFEDISDDVLAEKTANNEYGKSVELLFDTKKYFDENFTESYFLPISFEDGIYYISNEKTTKEEALIDFVGENAYRKYTIEDIAGGITSDDLDEVVKNVAYKLKNDVMFIRSIIERLSLDIVVENDKKIESSLVFKEEKNAYEFDFDTSALEGADYTIELRILEEV